ncbi:hypothetical protein [Endozoicomonas arenosclerae]|uniref:hypothetical protein n=1 Tax=Endozoicomonas arenosclerae TaxID=1633495 RepID=UPI000785A735|nr:hypothetical protein [Endozoicomonas arenosclerae]
MSRHVVDTNVFIVASGEHSESPFSSENHPVQDPDAAQKVFEWLMEFEAGNGRMVVDSDWEILSEYQNKLTDQDYGQRVVFEKMSRGEIDYVDVEWIDDPSHPVKVAALAEQLNTVIHDLADTKIVAACMKSNEEKKPCTIVNACDTDWYDWQEILEAAGVQVEQLIEEWSRQKWKEHHDR